MTTFIESFVSGTLLNGLYILLSHLSFYLLYEVGTCIILFIVKEAKTQK